jgi:hypothetical protein
MGTFGRHVSAFCLVATLVSSAHAQAPAVGQPVVPCCSPAIGTRVRITLRGTTNSSPGSQQALNIEGTITSADDSTVTIGRGRETPVTFQRATIARFERSNGKRSRGRQALIGFLAGAGAGGGVGYLKGRSWRRLTGGFDAMRAVCPCELRAD